ncbi:ABC transporter substrate-binding protein [Neptunomonas antarctica]|uniref:Monosaccharide ABC transporter substrate-binding protein, CUT2 family n=1 Tax=Neptunomonas antarctica TaxID=619304 RepID=A0A1N7LLL6_9GAMM|nr:ABC transporter substrate-binding protein [Neptunomonas antarctica]SIS74706.1 monosaccharide ABC transporter substrate-binding protein, CUT2 family [Neptunomonas antarctica]
MIYRRTSVFFLSLLCCVSSTCYAFNVTFINPGKQGEHFWDMVTDTMQAAAIDLDISLEVLYAERNRVQMRDIGIAVTEREQLPDVMLLVNEEQASDSIVKAASRKGVKVLMLLNDFLPAQKSKLRTELGPDWGKVMLGSITPDNFGAGARMMEALLTCARDIEKTAPINVLMIGGDQLTPASIDRNEGGLSILEKRPDAILKRLLYANWNQREATLLTNNYLKWSARNQITPHAIWAANDPIAQGALNALKQHNLDAGKDVCLVGLNWSSEGLAMVKNKEMVHTDGGHFLAGAWSMVLLKDIFTQAILPEIPININFEMQAINSQNLEQYQTTFGHAAWGKINFRKFLLHNKKSMANYNFSMDALFTSVKK